MRVIPTEIPTLEALSLPQQLAEMADLRNGIVLVTGPTGSGKSTTLAAIINLINEQQQYHIVTIEDPIEFLHAHKNSTINQREIGSDAKDFPSALRAALRQAPKVILIGEMRDYETTEIALEAAETGHLVLSTLHTIDASKTIDRIIGLYPKNEEQVIRTRLAQTFRYIVSQRLIPRADGRGPHRGGRGAEVHAAHARVHRGGRVGRKDAARRDARRQSRRHAGLRHGHQGDDRGGDGHARRRSLLRHQPEQPPTRAQRACRPPTTSRLRKRPRSPPGARPARVPSPPPPRAPRAAPYST